jgi:hypothetical protein
MDTSPYYQPQSIAPILERGAAQQVPLIAGQQGMNPALSAIGGLAQTGFDVAANNQKKQSVLAAQQAYSAYLAKVDNGTASEQDHAAGRMAAFSLGITPPDTLGMNLKKSEISKNDAQAAEATALANKNNRAPFPKADDPMKTAKMWQTQMNNIIPTIAKRGSPLGIAAVNNQRKDRLLEIAKNPNPTPQEVRLMETDLAGVMQGGSPQEDTLRATHYGSYYQDWAGFKGKITGTPQDANSPEIVAKLKELALGIGSVDNKVITNNLAMIEKYPSMTYLIKKDPQGWANFKQTMMGTLQTGDETPAPNGGGNGGGANPPVGYTLHKNNKTGATAYINAQGDVWQP